MGANIPEGDAVAAISGGWGCLAIFDVWRWRSELNRFSDPDFERILREEFTKASLKISGDQTNLFEQDRKTSDLQIGALVTSIKANLCRNTLNPLYDSGSAVIAVEWQIYSTSLGKVVARVPTRGGVKDFKGSIDGMFVKLLQLSFAENVRQLAADPAFRKIVLETPATAAPMPTAGPLAVAYHSDGKPLALQDAANGAVTIFAGDGMGSGVLISPDGYILTNHHVASAGRVRVRWPDHSESVGQVVRADSRRDVALIKVDAPKGRPLTLRRSPVDLGETVYAIGTPLRDELQNTVTRGVVSGMRTMDGESFIQSDAPITHGNSGGPLLDEKGAVVGLSDLGTDPALGSTINFFIPIDDALKVLALQPAG